MVLGTNVLSIKHCNVACKRVASVHSDCFGCLKLHRLTGFDVFAAATLRVLGYSLYGR